MIWQVPLIIQNCRKFNPKNNFTNAEHIQHIMKKIRKKKEKTINLRKYRLRVNSLLLLTNT